MHVRNQVDLIVLIVITSFGHAMPTKQAGTLNVGKSFPINCADTVFHGKVMVGADGMRFTLDPLAESVPPTTKVVESETSHAGS